MTSVRKTSDFQSVSIHNWQDLVQEESDGLEARGELQNLPDQGKPIKIWRTELDPEKDLAFSRLKNAGVVPVWMELDREIGERTDKLWAKLDWVESEIRAQLDQIDAPQESSPELQRTFWQKLKTGFIPERSTDSAEPISLTSVIAFRDRERVRFLNQASELDKKISSYHDSLPRGTEHLQRLRWIPSRAERVFDERIALSEWVRV